MSKFPTYLYPPNRVPLWVQKKLIAAGKETGKRVAHASTAAEVLNYLGFRAGHRAHIQVRQSVIADRLGMSAPTVSRSIRILKDLDLIEVQRTRRTSIIRIKFHPRYADEMLEYLDRKEAKAAREAAPPAVEVEAVEVEAVEDLVPRSNSTR